MLRKEFNAVKENKTEIMLILDKSGSMESMQPFIISTFNEFIESQKRLSGECSMSMVLFSDKYELKYLS